MDPIISEQRIAFLILKQRTLELTTAEQEELAAWLEADSCNRERYARLFHKDFQSDIARYRYIDTEKGWACYRRKYFPRRLSRHRMWYSAAAVGVLLITISSLFFYHMEDRAPVQNFIIPGGPKATLVLGDGSLVDLTAMQNRVIPESGDILIENSGYALDYKLEGDGKEALSSVYNELHIPVGGEYMLTMSDGTKIWLNSQTRLRYPVVFSEKERVVSLEGEAYFEVAKDKARPFRVMLEKNGSIEVLGTSFNVSAYNDDEAVEAVLEEGCIRMNSGKGHVVMSPGHRCVYAVEDGKMSVSEVNTSEFTAWRKGEFAFYGETVGSIMKKLARWYGVEVAYVNEGVKEVIFSGNTKRYENISVLLDAMELSGGVRFDISGRTVTVK